MAENMSTQFVMTLDDLSLSDSKICREGTAVPTQLLAAYHVVLIKQAIRKGKQT